MERLTTKRADGRWALVRHKGERPLDNIPRAIDRLAAYEDAEEQGLLARLPCKVGTPVFIIEKYADGNHIVPDMFDYYDLSAFGKTVFLTREEAEAALAKEG